MRQLLRLGILALAIVLGCARSRDTREVEYMPDMYHSRAIKAQEADPANAGRSLMREPPAGSIPRDFVPYQLALGDTAAANQLVNPLPTTPEVLAAGERYYNIFCITCHGPRGDGNGPIIPKMTRPPVLYSDKVRNWPDGRIYHTITLGQGNMPSYKSAIDPMTRWAIIHYVRALQRAHVPVAKTQTSAATAQKP